MRLFLNLFIFYWKRLMKSFFYLGIMLFFFVFLVIGIFIRENELYEYMMYGDLLGELLVIVQGAMLLYMVFFYKLFSDEYRFGANNLFIGTVKVALLKISSLLCNHVLIIFVFLSLQVSLIFTYYHYSEIPFSPFYWGNISYIFVYWFIPFLLAFFIGVIIALLFGKNKISFVLLILIWIGIGPMNTEIFSKYFLELSFSDFGNIFYIGPLQSYYSFNELVGYNISFSAYMKAIFWILCATAILLLVLLKSTRTGRERISLISISFLVLLTNILVLPQIFVGGKQVFNSKEESIFYKKQPSEISPESLEYTINKYDIKLNVIKKVSSETTVTVSNIDTNTLTFVLYHNFKVKKITNLDGNNLSFKQHGDFVEVGRISDTENDEFTFYYEMDDSIEIPVSKSYLYLPNYFSWIPVKANHAPFQARDESGESTVITSMQHIEPIEYTLYINGELPIYTNLSSNEDGIYGGKVTGGISVIAGEFRKDKYGDSEVIYPNSWPDISQDWPIYEKYLIKVHQEISRMFQIKEVNLPNKIVLLSPNLEQNSFLSSDHIVIQHPTLLSLGSAVQEIPGVYLPALLWNYNQQTLESFEQIQAFNEILAIFIRDKVGIDSPVPGPTTADTPYPTISAVEDFYRDFYQLSEEQQEEFLVIWYRKMHNVADDWLKTVKLFREYKENNDDKDS